MNWFKKSQQTPIRIADYDIQELVLFCIMR